MADLSRSIDNILQQHTLSDPVKYVLMIQSKLFLFSTQNSEKNTHSSSWWSDMTCFYDQSSEPLFIKCCTNYIQKWVFLYFFKPLPPCHLLEGKEWPQSCQEGWVKNSEWWIPRCFCWQALPSNLEANFGTQSNICFYLVKHTGFQLLLYFYLFTFADLNG